MADLPTTRRISFLPDRKRKPERAVVLSTTPVAVPILEKGDLRIVATRGTMFPGDTYAELAHVDGAGLFFRSEIFPDVASLERGVAAGPALRTSYPLLFSAAAADLPPIVEAVTIADLEATRGPIRIVDDGMDTAPVWAAALEQAFVVHDGTVWQKLGVPPLLALVPNAGSPMLGTFFGFGGKRHPSASLFGLHRIDEAEAFAASLGLGPVRRSADVYEILDADTLEAETPSADALVADRIRCSYEAMVDLASLHASLRRLEAPDDVAAAVSSLTAPYLLKNGQLLEAVEIASAFGRKHEGPGARFAAAMAPHLARRTFGQDRISSADDENEAAAFSTGF